MVDGSEKYRTFYANLICTAAKLDDARIEEAFLLGGTRALRRTRAVVANLRRSPIRADT